MIDIDRLERDIAAADGPVVGVSKSWLEQVLADLRSGRQARVKLAGIIATSSSGAALVAGLAR